MSHQTGLPNWGGETLEFNFEPGTDFGYSGEGYVYLQQAIEKLTNKDLQTLANELVFKPLNMSDSRFTWSEKISFPLAKGHDQAGRQTKRNVPKANAASSLHTTAQDYGKFMNAWLDPIGISKQSVNTALHAAITLKKDQSGKSLSNNNADIAWGLGWGIQKSNNQSINWHWGDNGVFRAFVAMNPKSKNGIVYFTNSQNGLAIAKHITDRAIGNSTPLFDWLGYGQYDSQLWQAMRQGYIAESNRDYLSAKKLFLKTLEQFPENKNLTARVKWIEQLLNFNKPITISKENKHKIAGQYGERLITLKNGELIYSRNGGKNYSLKPLLNRLFAVGDIYDFRLEVDFDADGNAKRLMGHYINGHKDESPRTE